MKRNSLLLVLCTLALCASLSLAQTMFTPKLCHETILKGGEPEIVCVFLLSFAVLCHERVISPPFSSSLSPIPTFSISYVCATVNHFPLHLYYI